MSKLGKSLVRNLETKGELKARTKSDHTDNQESYDFKEETEQAIMPNRILGT